MNKAFIREPEPDGRAYCPRCGSLGTPVHQDTLDHHVRSEHRQQLGDSAWFCEFARCEVAYFDLFDRMITVGELSGPVYPKDPAAPLCACFGFTAEDLEADVRDGTPVRIRRLLSRSQSDEAQCRTLAADGRCCIREVQRLYLRRIGNSIG